jgi:hypothetical protein
MPCSGSPPACPRVMLPHRRTARAGLIVASPDARACAYRVAHILLVWDLRSHLSRRRRRRWRRTPIQARRAASRRGRRHCRAALRRLWHPVVACHSGLAWAASEYDVPLNDSPAQQLLVAWREENCAGVVLRFSDRVCCALGAQSVFSRPRAPVHVCVLSCWIYTSDSLICHCMSILYCISG